MKTRKQKGRRGSTATGGSRAQLRRDTENVRPALFDAPAGVLALLRSVWAKRFELDQKTRDFVSSLLQQAQARPLSDLQLDAAAKVGARLGIGFDDPRLDDPGPAGAAPVRQPWGPLPSRPPGR